MSLSHLLALCRLVVGLAFAISFYRKAREFEEFQYSLDGFQLVPPSLLRPFAYLILTAEAVLMGLLVAGGAWLMVAFPFAILMLAVFSTAMLSVIVRQIENPCSCFGATDNLISGYDLLRNSGFILLAVAGWTTAGQSQALPVSVWLLIGAAALGLVLLWIRMREVLHFVAHDVSTFQKTGRRSPRIHAKQ